MDVCVCVKRTKWEGFGIKLLKPMIEFKVLKPNRITQEIQITMKYSLELE